MDVGAYLLRIGYSGSRTPGIDTLRELHRAHMFAVPFENLDIHLGRPIVLDTDALVRKVVEERRGGFCYELNAAFAALLGAMGFDVTLLSAGVARETGGFGPGFDHLALRVDLEERWLADVGFGDGFLEPLPLDRDSGGPFRVVDAGGWRIYERRAGGSQRWTPQYRFRLRPHHLKEFARRCRYHQTSSESSFTQKPMATIPTPDGRVTLSGLRLIRTSGEGRTDEPVSEDDVPAILRSYFGIQIA